VTASARPSSFLTTELLSRIRDGDRAAWNDLYARYRDRLLFAIRCRLGAKLREKLESEDVLQSVMMEALGELPTFAPRGPESLRRFLHVLIERKIRDRADTFGAEKRAGAAPLHAVAEPVAKTPSEAFDYLDGPRYRALERAMERLPDDLREMILLRKIDGLSSEEVAKRTGLTDDAVRKRTSRAMARLVRLAFLEKDAST
jgi:RNA polymerase sigma-70 factor, ECF subfamily